ncbi:MAG: SPFH/Band 7/PHB domain protein [Deltaproteobacteria bacterium]|nr:SPFH/Band 7/PHB domain protein [Deltaproteobacteria bacterium]
MDFGIFVALALVVFAISVVVKGAVVVQQSQCMIVERLGKFSRTLNSGFNVIIPFLDQPRAIYWIKNNLVTYTKRIDLRETVLDVPEQDVITKDNVSIRIDALMYIQITDAIKVTYEISNLPNAVAQLAQTSLRNVIGEMDLDETLASRDSINTKLKLILDEATDKWGLKVNRIELRNIMPPKDIQNAMEKQMQAERERRAKVLEAQGDKEARIARSEGIKTETINMAAGRKEEQILRAQGEAEAVLAVATAKKEAISQINSVVGAPALTVQFLIANSYLEVFNKFTTSEGDKIFIPYEASTSLGALGSIKELLASKK